jgi:hypothetical protein
MLRWILCAALPATALAQTVVILPPEMPGVALARALSDSEERVLVTILNTGTRPIRAVTVRYVRGPNVGGATRNMSSPLAPRTSWTFDGLPDPWGPNRDGQLTVSLDSVVYEDGGFAGPDLGQTRARYVRDREFVQEAIRQARSLANATDEAMRAWLAQMVAALPGPLSGITMRLHSRSVEWFARFNREGRVVLESVVRELSQMEQQVPAVSAP